MKSSLFTLGIISTVLAAFFVSPSHSSTPLNTNDQTVQALKEGRLTIAVQSLVIGESKPGPGLPIRLIIPAINVNASFDYVGLTPDGVMDITNNPRDVVWYELGPRPGDNGSAVIAGHYGQWRNGAESVFDDLDKLRPGDVLYVQDEKGSTTTFVVRALRTYAASEDATSVFGSGDGKAHLNLVTCAGTWSTVTQSYSQRLVVFTDKQ